MKKPDGYNEPRDLIKKNRKKYWLWIDVNESETLNEFSETQSIPWRKNKTSFIKQKKRLETKFFNWMKDILTCNNKHTSLLKNL